MRMMITLMTTMLWANSVQGIPMMMITQRMRKNLGHGDDNALMVITMIMMTAMLSINNLQWIQCIISSRWFFLKMNEDQNEELPSTEHSQVVRRAPWLYGRVSSAYLYVKFPFSPSFHLIYS